LSGVGGGAKRTGEGLAPPPPLLFALLPYVSKRARYGISCNALELIRLENKINNFEGAIFSYIPFKIFKIK